MPPIDFSRVHPRKLRFDDDLTDFNCDYEDDLGCNDFIHRDSEAKQYQRERHGITYLFLYDDKKVGYVTLAMSSISAKRLEKADTASSTLRAFPSLLIGRLAVDNDFRRSNIGSYMADWSTGIALELSVRIGCRYVILQTTENKVKFYSKCGFRKGAVLRDERHVVMYKKIAIEGAQA